MFKKKFEDIVDFSNQFGIKILTPKNEYKNTKQKLIISDGIYKASVTGEVLLKRNNYSSRMWFHRSNPFLEENIKQYLIYEKDNNFELLSKIDDSYTRNKILDFRCKRCGEIIHMSFFNALRGSRDLEKDYHRGLICPICDGRNESLHAIVLKQLFINKYPDTVLEDPSCINPNTNAIMCTDIVNHRLKIAIEIQGQFHERETQKKRDKIKKEFWINKGYKFYDYKIDKISVLDYCKLFFPDLKEIPDWVIQEDKNKLDIRRIQSLLNEGNKVTEIANLLDISPHRIYDALYSNRLFYPKNYNKYNYVEVMQFSIDYNYINSYINYKEAERKTGILSGNIGSCIHTKKYYANGYYWIPKKIYIEHNKNKEEILICK